MLTPLENAVIELMLDKSGEHSDTLRQQLKHVKIDGREASEAGVFTNFMLPVETPVRRDPPDMTISNVGVEFPSLQHGAGFVLFIRGGVVTLLEGFTYGEAWPANTNEFVVRGLDRT